jgi:hypothetical protein
VYVRGAAALQTWKKHTLSDTYYLSLTWIYLKVSHFIVVVSIVMFIVLGFRSSQHVWVSCCMVFNLVSL